MFDLGDIFETGFDILKVAVIGTNPIAGIVISTIEKIVGEEGEVVSNDSVKNILEAVAKSSGNNLDDIKLNKIFDILEG